MENWAGFVDQFSRDLVSAFTDIAGFSSNILRYCRAFYNFYNDSVIWQQVAAKLGKNDSPEKWQQPVAERDSFTPNNLIQKITGQVLWGHNIHIFTKSKNFEDY